jgi:hypothetical protein
MSRATTARCRFHRRFRSLAHPATSVASRAPPLLVRTGHVSMSPIQASRQVCRHDPRPARWRIERVAAALFLAGDEHLADTAPRLPTSRRDSTTHESAGGGREPHSQLAEIRGYGCVWFVHAEPSVDASQQAARRPAGAPRVPRPFREILDQRDDGRARDCLGKPPPDSVLACSGALAQQGPARRCGGRRAPSHRSPAPSGGRRRARCR